MAKKKRSTEKLEFYAKIGKRIKELRIKDNLTQKEMAKNFQVSQRIIAAYEKGDINIPFYSIVKLCEFFKVSVNYFAVQLGSEEDIKGFLSVPNTMDVLKTVINNIDILKHIINKDI